MFELPIVVGSLLVGFTVGLTGMGGGALMTPMLVLAFGVDPLTAVSSDLIAAAVMKPLGGAVHARRGTVQWPLVKALLLGSVPAAFLGVFLIRQLDSPEAIDGVVRSSLGSALLLVAAGLSVRFYFLRRRASTEEHAGELRVRWGVTLALGVLGGLIVGTTSVGSGSLMILGMMLLYPKLRLSDLVGTDLVQAVPLVASAALAHLVFGELALALTLSIILGSVPGVIAGAQLSSRFPDKYIRPALITVLVASGSKLLGFDTATVAWLTLAALGMLLAGPWLPALRRRSSPPKPELRTIERTPTRP